MCKMLSGLKQAMACAGCRWLNRKKKQNDAKYLKALAFFFFFSSREYRLYQIIKLEAPFFFSKKRWETLLFQDGQD